MGFLTLIPRWVWGLLGGAIALVCFALWQQKIGEERVREEYREMERAAIAKRIEDNAELARIQARQQAALKKGYQDEVDQVKRAAARAAGERLPLPPSICTGLAGAAEAEGSTGSAARVAATIFLPDRITQDLQALMERADMIVASCRVAQQFIIENGFKE